MPPVIGITPSPTFDALPHGTFHRLALAAAYAEAVAAAGGTPIVLPLGGGSAEDYLPLLDGVLLSGGGDVEPERYGDRNRHPTTYGVSPVRDELELALVRAAVGAERPLLAICRGLQVLNVALGGTLIQDIASQFGGDGRVPHRQHEVGLAADEVGHPVSLGERWPLAETAGGNGSLGVNSFHHQAIDRLGPGLEPVACSPDGVVEAVVLPGHPFLLGVQWHPELMFRRHPEQLEPFRALVAAAGATAAPSGRTGASTLVRGRPDRARRRRPGSRPT